MSNQRTMQVLSYGFSNPEHLLGKLEREGGKLTDAPSPDDIFNFIVTAAVLGEWVRKHYQTDGVNGVFRFDKKEGTWLFPDCVADWMTDKSCFRNEHHWLNSEISDVLSISAHMCNASKHYAWADGGKVEDIRDKAAVGNWAEYFFASTAKDVYIVYEGANYGLKQIRGILLQFYKGLIPYLEERKQETADN